MYNSRAINLSLCGRLFWLPLLLCALLMAVVWTPDAYATSLDYQIGTGDGTPNASGGVNDLEVNKDFSCAADGSANGELFINSQCDATQGLFGVFANVICRVENVFAMILGLVYCSVQAAILEPLLAVLTLYVTIYGAMVLLGMVQTTFTEAMTRIAKIGIVSAVALNAHVAIGIGYTFFISLTQATVSIIFDLFTPEYVQNNSNLSNMIAAGYISTPTHTDEASRLYTGENWILNLEYTTSRIIGFASSGGWGLLLLLIGLLLFLPPAAFLLIYLLFSTIKAFATAIVGYLLALLGITFMFTLSPIFICFALFRFTAGWFDNWLRMLFSYALQVVTIFTFLMILIMVNIVNFFEQVGVMLRGYQANPLFGPIPFPFFVISLCKPMRSENGGFAGDILYYKFSVDGSPSTETGTIYEGFPRCIPSYDAKAIIEGTTDYYPIGLDYETTQALKESIDNISEEDLEAMNSGDMPSGLQTIYEIVDEANKKLVIPIQDLPEHSDLVTFLMVRFLAIIVLTYLLDRFLQKVPHMATMLAGTDRAGRLGGGKQDHGDMAGLQNPKNFAGIETGFARFKSAYMGEVQRTGSNIGAGHIGRSLLAGVGGMRDGMLANSLGTSASLGLSDEVRAEMEEDTNLLQYRREGVLAWNQDHSGSNAYGRGGIGQTRGRQPARTVRSGSGSGRSGKGGGRGTTPYAQPHGSPARKPPSQRRSNSVNPMYTKKPGGSGGGNSGGGGTTP